MDEALGVLLKWREQREQIEHVLRKANARLAWFTNMSQGYCGWLVTNPTFRAEHLKVFTTWRKEIAEYGIPGGEVITGSHSDLPKRGVKKARKLTSFVNAFWDFFARWQLSGMRAPFLPLPLHPQLPALSPQALHGHMNQGGSTFYMPDTFSIPSRDLLRQIMEDAAMRSNAPDHLKEWQALVRGDQPSKNKITRYARIFQLQHFWRALQSRHSAALRRRSSQMEPHLATFLGTSANSLRRDLRLITSRLGKDWTDPQ